MCLTKQRGGMVFLGRCKQKRCCDWEERAGEGSKGQSISTEWRYLGHARVAQNATRSGLWSLAAWTMYTCREL